ncbi:conserved Plasmodium protein, unknown function [Plasmodium gallinaceum]|uniref:Uncharacterized protein n=1 Tax=Plasmodium gallinaceum TaxID=5849 RepID=A0A1J1GNX9_PLAGA|nr:conserved Plasmodium protein, unknown function [Plasmodium gallinaceum]CRG94191.1 conserved Plasmodium protein, unknown function [Plasmodium gallinaceum]
MKICKKTKIFFKIFVFFCFFFKYEFARGLYETKAYPLIHMMNNNDFIGSSIHSLKNNIINLLFLYKDIKFKENYSTIDELADLQDETKIERLIREKVQYINKFVNKRQLIKFSGFIYLYEIINENNIYFLMHFIMTNNNNGIVIILPNNSYIDTNEFFRINKIKECENITAEKLEKRILFFQSLILNLKLNQSIYFIKNDEEIEYIYDNYKSKFGYFDLTRNISVQISKSQNIYKLNSKNLFFFLSKDNININSIFNKQQNNETFILTKKKTIIICVDYNVFNVVSDFSSHTTSTNSSIIAVIELIKLFSEVYKNEDVNYNILFFFTNYYYGISNFIDNINSTFKDSIEFVVCLDNLNESEFYIHETKKDQPHHILRFYEILKQIIKINIKKDIKMETQKIKIHNKHLPKTHEYFVLKNFPSFSLSSKNRTVTFLNRTPIIEQKLKKDNLKNHIKNIFESIYIYIKDYEEKLDEEKIQNELSYYTNLIKSDAMTDLNENLNKYNKFFIYKEDTMKLFNYLKIIMNHYINDSNFLIKDYKIPHDKKQKFFYQKYVNIAFSMTISYIFHYIHFLFVSLFLIITYLLVNFYFVPSFYKNTIK